jgi:hypothetical protein
MTQFAADPIDVVEPTTRTSVLAVAGFVTSLICCIPGLGSIGALLGIASIIAISSSGHEVRGKGLAIAAVALGLVITLLQIGAVFGINLGVTRMGQYSEIIVAIENGDRQALAPWITSDLENALTDEQIESFADAFTAEFGAFKQAPHALLNYIRDFAAVRQDIEVTRNAGAAGTIIPVPVETDNGVAAIVLIGDSRLPKAPNGLMRVNNVGFVADDGSIVWLVDPSTP